MTFDPAALKVVDADTHIVEEGDLWTSRVPASLRDRVPHVELNAEGDPTWVMEGVELSWAYRGTVIARDGSKTETVRAYADWTGLDDIHRGSYQVAPRLEVMDDAGIWAQVVFPNNVGLGGQSVGRATNE